MDYSTLPRRSVQSGFWRIGIGITVARPVLLPWTATCAVHVCSVQYSSHPHNFSWVERWLAQRRTREIFGILLFFITIGFQFIGPAIERFSHKPAPGLIHNVEIISAIQRVLPPGLAASSISYVSSGQFAARFDSTWRNCAPMEPFSFGC